MFPLFQQPLHPGGIDGLGGGSGLPRSSAPLLCPRGSGRGLSLRRGRGRASSRSGAWPRHRAGQSTQNARNWAAIIGVCRCMGNRPPCCLPEPCRPFFFSDARDLHDDPTDHPRETTRVWRSPPDHPRGPQRRGHPNGADIARIVARSVGFSSVLAPRNGVPVATLTRPCRNHDTQKRLGFCKRKEIIRNGTSFALDARRVWFGRVLPG